MGLHEETIGWLRLLLVFGMLLPVVQAGARGRVDVNPHPLVVNVPGSQASDDDLALGAPWAPPRTLVHPECDWLTIIEESRWPHEHGRGRHPAGRDMTGELPQGPLASTEGRSSSKALNCSSSVSKAAIGRSRRSV